MTEEEATGRPSKRGGGDLVSIDDCLLARAWDHYKNFIGIIDNGDEENEIDEDDNEAFEGDIDELLKVIGLL